MNTNRLFHRLTILAAAIAVIVLVAPAALARTVRLDADVATPMMLAGSAQRAYVRVALTGITGDGLGHRAPVNVALVIDRSGSMQGHKIAEAKRAAIMALDWLDDEDVVSVITYQSTVHVLVPATKLRDRAAVRRRIEAIEAGGNTALFGGVSMGAREVRKFIDRERVNLVILLSDGLANVGPSSPGELADLGSSLARNGIAVTTIGLGLDYNEDLMTRLAYKSDGNHFFVEDARQLASAYATEFGDLLSVVAQNVQITISCRPGVRPVRVVGREAEIADQRVHASMGQLYGDQTRFLVLEVEVPAGSNGQTTRLAEVTVTYDDMRTARPARLSADLPVSFTNSRRIVEEKTDRAVMASVVGLMGADQAERAMALRDAGKVEEARAAFYQNMLYLAEQAKALDSEELNKDAATNVKALENLDEGQWDRERKAQQEYQFKTRQQRAPIKDDEGKKKN